MKPSFLLRCFLFFALCCGIAPLRAATFDITYGDPVNVGFNDPTLGAARRAAFEAAVGVWQKRLTSSVPIKISAQFSSQGGAANYAVLAYAGPSAFLIDWPASTTSYQPRTGYPSALANKLAGRDLTPPATASESDSDIDVICNADVDNAVVLGASNWYYGTDGNNGIHIDFFSTMIHEIGHGLGFLSSINRDGSMGVYDAASGIGPYPLRFDQFMESGAAGSRVLLTNMTNAGRTAAQTGNQLFFNGPATRANNGGVAAKLYAPSAYEDGSSASHLDEATYSGNNESMTPLISGVTHDPGPATTGMFRDMGWTVANSDTTPPALTCSYPTAGNLRSFTADGTGAASDAPGIDTTLVPRVQVHLLHRATGYYWSGTGWFSTTATKLVNAPQVPSTYNTTSKTWRVALSSWPSPAELYDRADYTLFVIARDTAGNKTILQREIRIDSNPPAVGWNYANNQAIADLAAFGGAVSAADRVTFQVIEYNAPATSRYWNGSAWQNAAPDGSGPRLNGAISGATWNRGTTPLPSAAQMRNGNFCLTVRAFNASGTFVGNPISVTKRSEVRAPTVAITSPLAGGTFTSFPPIAGTAFDGESSPGVAGSGVQRIDFALRRLADNKHWNGSSWTTVVGLQAPATRTSNGNATWSYGGALPSGANVTNGSYRILAFAVDFAGNVGPGVARDFSILKPVARTTSPVSPVQLSTIGAATNGTIRLVFTGALGTSAANANNYVVTNNGAPIPIGSIAQPDSSTVEFRVGALTAGVRITVAYDISDLQGRAVAGTASVVAK